MFTAQELEEMRRADLEIEQSFALTPEERKAADERDIEALAERTEGGRKEVLRRRDSSKRDYRKNSEKRKAYSKAYREKNREKVKALQRRWYLDNRERLKREREEEKKNVGKY